MNELDKDFSEKKTIESEKQDNKLPDELSEPNAIYWIHDWIDLSDFHGEEEFLGFIKTSWFDKIYYINVDSKNIDKYADIKSVYDLLARSKELIYGWNLHLVIFRRWEQSYSTAKQETDRVIWEYADERMKNNKEYREELVEALRNNNFDTSQMGDENVRKKLIEYLGNNPWFTRIFSDGAKYKYLIWWYSKYQPLETWKRYIDAVKRAWIDMVEVSL